MRALSLPRYRRAKRERKAKVKAQGAKARYCALSLALLICTLVVRTGFCEERVALVIGNGAYREAPALPNPRNDAQDVAAALKRTGFQTISRLDLDKAGMEQAVIEFARAAKTADVVLFYYSGHAVQFSGMNYLAPVDARLSDEADLKRMVRLDEIVSDMQQAKSLRILVLDSCRDNPFVDSLRRSLGTTRALSPQRGLAKIDSPQGTIVAYATQAGRTAEDGNGRNSPYTEAFLRHIETREEIGTIFRRISTEVYRTTNRLQLPELSLSIIGEFFLYGNAREDTQQSPTKVDALRIAPSSKVAPAGFEDENRKGTLNGPQQPIGASKQAVKSSQESRSKSRPSSRECFTFNGQQVCD